MNGRRLVRDGSPLFFKRVDRTGARDAEESESSLLLECLRDIFRLHNRGSWHFGPSTSNILQNNSYEDNEKGMLLRLDAVRERCRSKGGDHWFRSHQMNAVIKAFNQHTSINQEIVSTILTVLDEDKDTKQYARARKAAVHRSKGCDAARRLFT
jgi:hypothetical protein